MTPVITYRGAEPEVYLPGSSLKGVFRSHVEKVIRTLGGAVCDPFGKLQDKGDEAACSDKFEIRSKMERDLSNEQIYQDSCPACRLFGSTSFIGRVSIGDAYLPQGSIVRTESRDGVGIDRFTGGASRHAKFELEVVSANMTFETQIHLRNFECWQLGALLLVAKDLEDGFIHIGSGKSRGLGAVKGTTSQVQIFYPARPENKPGQEVWGLGKFLSERPLQGDLHYGTFQDDFLVLDTAPEIGTQGIRTVNTFKNVVLTELQDKSMKEFVKRMKVWKWQDSMKAPQLGSGGRR